MPLCAADVIDGGGVLSSLRPIDFSYCFENSILIPVPILCLAALSLIRVLCQWRTGKASFGASASTRRAGLLYSLKCILSAAYVTMLAVAIWQHSTHAGRENSPNLLIAYLAVLIGGLVQTVALQYQHCRRGQVSSLIAVVHLVTLLVVSVRLRSLLRSPSDYFNAESWQLPVTSMIVAMNAAAFLLENIPLRSSVGLCEYEEIPFVSRISFSFIQPFMLKASTLGLTPADVPPCPENETADYTFDKLNKQLRKLPRITHFQYFLALFRTFSLRYSYMMALKASGVVFVTLQPLILDRLLCFFETYEKDESGTYRQAPQPAELGYLMAFTLLFLGIAGAICDLWGWQLATRLAFRFEMATSSAVFRKALRLSPAERVARPTGDILNLVTTDCDEISYVAMASSDILIVLIQVVAAMTLMYMQLGLAILAGAVLLVLLGPAQAKLADVIAEGTEDKMGYMDKRVQVINEVINNIKVVKMYAWEAPFIEKILNIRQKELKHLRIKNFGDLGGRLFGELSPMLIFVVMLAVYSAIDDAPMTPSKIFVSLSLFQLLKEPLTNLSMYISVFMAGYASIRRIADFLQSKEHTEYVTRFPRGSQRPAVRMKDASFIWEIPAEIDVTQASHSSGPILKDIDLLIPKGSFLVLAGRVGAGKSSVLMAILGSMERLRGVVEVCGSVAYVAQKPWVVNASIRDNILFGRDFDQQWYDQVVEACALGHDIAMFSAGDMTEVGERGLNLSGGQRQRVALARSIYQNRDIYLLDDIFSAVDPRVARHIFEKLFGSEGLLAGKTVVLVTHAVQLLPPSVQIAVIDDGCIIERGILHELVTDDATYTATLIRDAAVSKIDRVADNAGNENDCLNATPCNDIVESGKEDDGKHGDQAVSANDGTLVDEEEIEEGRISWKVVSYYLQACSVPLFAAFVAGVFLTEGINLGSVYWLQHWSSQGDNANHGFWYFFGIYAAIVFLYCVTIPLAGALWQLVISIRISTLLHERLLRKIFRAPMFFFDTTPAGRILNRFSRDITNVDNRLAEIVFASVTLSASALIAVIPAVIITPLIIPVLVIIGTLSIVTLQYYMCAARPLSRFAASAQAPIFSHVGETLEGIATLKAFEQDDRFIARHNANADRYISTTRIKAFCQRWLSLAIRFFTSLIVFAVASLAVAKREYLSPALVGLALSQAFSLSQLVATLMQTLGELENEFVSVERLWQYRDLPQEAPEETFFPLKSGWPERGAIEFDNFSIRYREGLDLILRNIKLSIAPGERIGVVGRTGAGKSSLALALFRLMEASVDESQSILSLGRILIDGVDVATVGLRDLRKSLGIIPQEPVLFAGTYRSNLDPFDDYSDDELWTALEQVGLKKMVFQQPAGLDAEIHAGGDNLSLGQKQLICVARASLRKCRILVLDEATASVDAATDALVQQVVRKVFEKCTIITVAHRIHTILDNDRLIVLSDGQICEVGPPKQLLEDSSSVFYQFVHGERESGS
ncbi:P-loop containing nucleoside triphosphate hydrolase protein [Gaertneriomyces semiglobifer]|nr:P-loop containing nucleoside triphosphate hydrolase protein [Gaertneriomyces semiglobifer]